ncbi:hypothetical protein A3SI_04562 [Nitritalea halalkaliphila LW7]|uniref:Uncharacterized protein n=1 Tax=Nitritalea halalkaliphila LW7 TaxID=1189621 RepID=I5C8B1_9BACT|nr:hypothetical protein [Nitritalea halalkaliphila]EIM78063.1 hypothetical protein A3SI_04562 [Nitritalea halalkaliphila LW7]
MNLSELVAAVKSPADLSPTQYGYLVKLHEDFPYCAVVNLVLAHHERQRSQGKRTNCLHWAAISVSDRRYLYDYVHDATVFSAPAVQAADQPVAHSENAAEESPSLASPEENEDGALREALESTPDFSAGYAVESATAADEEGDAETSSRLDALIAKFDEGHGRLRALPQDAEETHKKEDLSKSSTELKMNLVTESYAKLLTLQGKTAKAKEIYEQLMVKFPNKKAYFADLIAGLDKKEE